MADHLQPAAAVSPLIPSQAVDPFLSIHAIRVFVRNLDRSLRFYQEQLGFRLVIDARLQSGQRWVAVSPPDGTAILGLVAPRPNTVEHKLIGRATQVSLVTSDVAGKFQEWSRRGVRFLSPPRLRRIKYEERPLTATSTSKTSLLGEGTPIWGGVFARFRDIDGNVFSLVSFDEVTHAIETRRRTAAEKLQAERRVAHELEIARQVQTGLFPQSLPPLPLLDYAGACFPARVVGGDYYDFLNLGANRLGLVVADVAGKGIAAALLMASLQANVRSQLPHALNQPRVLLQSVNLLFSDNTPDGAFATLFYAEYDDPSGGLRYVNCGHLPALLLRADQNVERLHSTSPVLGIFRNWDCAVGECCLEPGDLLALYTDGVTEALNRAGDEFGEDRLIESLRTHRGNPAASVLESVVGDVRVFAPQDQHDDITLMIVKRRQATGDAA